MVPNVPQSGFQRFLKSRIAPYVGMALAFLVCALFLYTGILSALGICGPFLVGIALYAIPKGMGADWKKLLVFGVVFLAATSAIFTFAVTNPILEDDSAKSSGEFKNVQVTDLGNDQYEYSFEYTGSGDIKLSWGNASVQIRFVGVSEHDSLTMSDPGPGTYTHIVEFEGEDVYYLKLNNAIFIGPVTMEGSDITMYSLKNNLYYIGVNVMIVFFMIVLVTAWMRNSLEKTRTRLESEGRLYPPGYGACKNCGTIVLPGEVCCRKCGAYIDVPEHLKVRKVDYFVCDECGKEVPGDADTCPACGAHFDDVVTEVFDPENGDETVEPNEEDHPHKTFTCSVCGEEVPGNARKCPKCGSEFEN